MGPGYRCEPCQHAVSGVLGAKQIPTCLTLVQIIMVGTAEGPVEVDFSAWVSANGDAGWSRFLLGYVGGVVPLLVTGRVVLLSSAGVGPRGRPWGGCAYACRRVRGADVRADERVMVRGGWRASGPGRPGRRARRWRGLGVGRRPRCGACRSPS